MAKLTARDYGFVVSTNHKLLNLSWQTELFLYTFIEVCGIPAPNICLVVYKDDIAEKDAKYLSSVLAQYPDLTVMRAPSKASNSLISLYGEKARWDLSYAALNKACSLGEICA